MFDFDFTASDAERPCRTGRLSLRGTATIDCCNELKAALLDALESSRELIVEVGELDEIDLSGLQLLCAAHKSAMQRDKLLSLRGERSPSFESRIEEGGFHCTLPSTCLKSRGESCLWFRPEPAAEGETP